MFTGPTVDKRANAVFMLRTLAERAEDTDVPLRQLGAIAREIAAQLLDEEPASETGLGTPTLRVIKGGRASGQL